MSDFSWSLQIALIGILVVFTTLFTLQLLLQVPRLFTKAKVSPVQPQVKQAESSIPPEHLAVIAAAVSMLGGYRVKTIEISGNENWERCRYTDIARL